MTARISRRQALFLLAGGTVAAGGAIVAFRRDGDGSPDEPHPDGPSSPVVSGELAVIGERYLTRVPDEASTEVLTERLDLPEGPVLGSFAAVRARIHRELAEGEVVTVDGWVLSVTEARLCALVALGD